MTRLILASLLLVLALCAATTAQSQIFFVRHAEKADAGTDNKDPELSEAGRTRAESLGRMFKDAGLTAIYATEFKRTQQTAEGVARLAHVDVTPVPAKDTDALTARLADVKGSALIVGHSNTIPAIIKALGVSTAVALGENDYDDLFIVVTEPEPRLVDRSMSLPLPAK
ncbi:MAG: histidine phosphatase family protein [Chthoniobacterales bacterium]|nr:histidine phosphatase family protein [Chthoniobacterales bacterium]